MSEEVLNALCREKLSAFTAKSFTIVEPTTPFEHNWHIDCIAEHLQAVWENEIRYLIINMPPRSLKTHTTSVAFEAWGLGKDPSIQFMLTSFKASLAEKMTRKTRRIMQSDWYKSCFPNTKLSEELNRQYYFETTANGQYFSSAMANVTGEGCDVQLCFPKGTYLYTNDGDRCISTLRPNDLVWSFSHERNQSELRKVNKIFSRSCTDLLEVRSIDGNRVLCTPEHHFWVVGFGYKSASTLTNGDKIIQGNIREDTRSLVCNDLRLLFSRIQATEGRLRKVITLCEQGILLLEQMFKRSPQYKEPQNMCDLQPEDRKQIAEILHELQNEILASTQTIGIHKAIQSYQAVNRIQRQLFMCSMYFQDQNDGSPYRRNSEQQSARESNNDVSDLSCQDTPQLYTGTIESIKRYSVEELSFYDVSVEGNSNFFAEGVLVHNCDDPLAPDEALSDQVRESTIETIRGTLFSRFNDPRTGRFVLNMQRLHDDDPTGNLLKEQGWYHLKLPAEAKGRSYSYSIRGKSWELKEGDLLFPSRFTPEVLEKSRQLLGDYGYAGQYLQEPVPIGGGLINQHWMQYYAQGSVKPASMNLVILVDPAGGDDTEKQKKDKKSDWTAMVVVGLGTDNNYYLLDLIRDRLNPTERINTLFMLHRLWNAKTGRSPKVGYEKYSMQSDLHYIDKKKNEDAYHFPLIPLAGPKSKTTRVSRLVPDMQNGRWYFPTSLLYVDGENRKWDLIQELINVEIKTFPMSKYDDVLDALSRIYEPDLNMAFPKPKVGMVSKARIAALKEPDNWEAW